MALEFDCKGLLDIGIKAKLRTFNATGLDADKVAVIYYEVPLGAGAGCIDWLKENRKTVKDVQIDFQMLSGVWRSAGIVSEQSTKNKESVTIAQTFKYGWIQSLLSGDAVDWSEARYVRGNESAEPTVLGEYPVTDPELNPQQYHLVKWEGIDPLKLDAVRRELRDLTPSAWSPTVNGESLGSGLFLLDLIAETGAGQDQDRSGTITALIAKPRFSLQAWENYGTPAQAKAYYLYDVPMYLAQSIVNLYNKREGTTASAGAPNERFLMNIQVTDKPDESTTDKHISFRSCALWSVTTFYHNVADVVVAPANTMGITYSARFDLIRQTGMYSGTIEKRVRQTQKTGPYRSTNTHGQTVNVTEWTGLHVVGDDYKEATLSESAGDISVSLGDAITLPSNTITKGNTWQVSKRTNDDCTADVTVQERAEIAIEDLEYTAQDSAASSTDVLEKFNQQTPVTLAAGVNEVLRADVRYNKETGLMDVVQQTTASKELDGDEVQESAAQKQTVTRKTNTATELADPIPEAGKIKTVTRQETEFTGRKNTTESVVEAKTQTSTGGQARADQTSVVEIETQATIEAVATPESGKIVVVDNRPTEFSRYATRKETITPVNQTNTEGSASAAATAVVSKATQAEAEAEATPEPGKIVRVSNQSTEFGKVRTVKEVITPTDQSGEGAVVRADQTSETETHTQANAPADDTPIAGKIVQADSRPTEFGKYATQKTIITPTDQTGQGADIRADQTSETETHTQADEAADETPITGKIVRANSQPTEFGKYRTSREVISPVDQESTIRHEDHAETFTETQHTQSDTALEDPVEELGKIIDRSSVPTEFGKYRTTDRTREAKSQSVEHLAQSDASQTINRTWEKNADVKAEATAIEGKVVTARSVENEYGKFDNEKVEVVPINQEGEAYREDLYVSRTTETNTASDEIPSATFSQNSIETVLARPTPFGKYQTEKETIVANPVSDVAKTSTADYFSKRKVETDRNQIAPGDTITLLDGTKIKTSSWTRNEFDSYDNQMEEIEPTARDSGWEEYQDRWGTSYYRFFRNQQTLPVDGFDSDTDNSIQFALNAHGLIDGTASRRAYQGGGEDDEIIWTEVTGFLRKPEFSRHKNTSGDVADHRRFHTFSIKTKVEETMAGAQDQERAYQNAGEPPIETSIKTGTLKYGGKFYMARAIFYDSTDDWEEL